MLLQIVMSEIQKLMSLASKNDNDIDNDIKMIEMILNFLFLRIFFFSFYNGKFRNNQWAEKNLSQIIIFSIFPITLRTTRFYQVRHFFLGTTSLKTPLLNFRNGNFSFFSLLVA